MKSRKELSKQLNDAVKTGDLKAIRAALDDGAEIDDNENITALCNSVFFGNISAVKLLLDNRANIDKPASSSAQSETPLMTAITYGHTDIIDLLLARGANVNARWENGICPIILAANKGNAVTVKKLLQRGAEYMQSYRYGSNTLAIYCARGHGACVELFVDDLISRFTTNPKDLLIFLKNNDLLKICLKHAKDSASFRPLLKLLNFLYSNHFSKADIHPLLPNQGEFQHLLFRKDVTAYLKSLPLQSRYHALQDVEGPGYNVFTDLCYGQRTVYYDSEHLNTLYQETDIELRNFKQLKDKTELKKKLYEAATTGDVEAAEICIANGAPVNEAVNSRYDLPIYAAVVNGRADMVAFLISKGADKNYYRKAYLTASETLSEAAAARGHVEVLKVLDQHGALPNSQFNLTYNALRNNKIEAAKYLFERGYYTTTIHPDYIEPFNVLLEAVINYPEFLNYMIDTILTWPIEKTKKFLIDHDLRDCFFHACVSYPDRFMPLMRLIDHLYASGADHKFMDQFVPNASFFTRSKKYKSLMLAKADELSLEEKSPYLATILDPNHFRGKLARKAHGWRDTDELHTHSTLGKAAATKKEVDTKLAAKGCQLSSMHATATAIKDAIIPAPEPVVEPQPVAVPQPVVEPQPVTVPQPVIEPQPVVAHQVATTTKPVAVEEPVAAPKPQRYINPFMSAIELAFSSDDFPANLPAPIEPVKVASQTKVAAETEADRFFSHVRKSSVQPAVATNKIEQQKKAIPL